MNKAQLYAHCKSQEEEIQRLTLFNEGNDDTCFLNKMDEHIKFHMTDSGGEYNYIDNETGEHIFLLGSKGTLDDCVDFVEELKKENKKLKGENKQLILERDSFEKEFHFTLGCQVKDEEQFKKEKKELQEKYDALTIYYHKFINDNHSELAK